MTSILKLDFGESLSFSKYVESNNIELSRYIIEPDLEFHLEEILKNLFKEEEEDDVDNPLYEDFNIITEDMSSDSYGEGAHAEHFFIKLMLISNEKLGVMFYLNFSGYYDGWGDYDYSEIEGDIFVYDYSFENKNKIEDCRERKREEYLERKKSSDKFIKEMKERKSIEKKRVSDLRSKIELELLKDGFTQCVSKKGNLISEYEIDFYAYNNVLYSTFEEVSSTIDDFDNMDAELKLRIFNLCSQSTKVRITGKGVLEPVKKDSVAELYNFSKLYTIIVNLKCDVDYNLASYMKDEVEKFRYYNKGYLELMNTQIQVKINIQKASDERFRDMMSDIFKMF